MSSAYEDKYGKLDLSSRIVGGTTDAASQRLSALTEETPDNDEAGAYASDVNDPALPPARAYAEMYCQPVVRSVLLADQFMRWSRRDGRTEEANLWSLLFKLLSDAEESSRYDPDAIGIAAVQPHRRWFISQHAHIQDLLQRHSALRHMNVVLRWLEQTYREGNTPQRLTAARSPEEAVLLRQLILSHLRGGELQRAVDLAVTAQDCTYSCVLSAAQLQSVQEPWLHHTLQVQLFGEYGYSSVNAAWTGNERRLDNMAQLHFDAVSLAQSSDASIARGGLDAVIAAVLCGNLDVMAPAFLVSGSWRDVMWCQLRSTLVLCFTKTLIDAGLAVPNEYAAFVARNTGAEENWQDATARRVAREMATRMEEHYLHAAPLEEQLQMRIILQFLAQPGESDEEGGGYVRDWLHVAPDRRRDSSRLVAHLLLCLDAAYTETLHPFPLQAQSNSLVMALAPYAQQLAQLPRYAPRSAMAAVIKMSIRLLDERQRAAVYAAFLIARREFALGQNQTSREAVEREEEHLVRLFCGSDPHKEVRAEVLRLLDQRTPHAALLTHCPVAECVLWRAMHASSYADYREVLCAALDACEGFWLAKPQAELDAITDVANILRRSVLPALQIEKRHSNSLAHLSHPAATTTAARVNPNNNNNNNNNNCSSRAVAAEPEPHDADARSFAEESTQNLDDAARRAGQFWISLAESRAVADDHARAAAQLDVAHTAAFQTAGDRTLLSQLAQEEAALLRRLRELALQALRDAGAVVHRCRDCVTAAAWVPQVFLEEAALSARLAWGGGGGALPEAFALVEHMGGLGYFDPALLTRQSAIGLFAALQAVRIASGQREHDRHVKEAKRAAAAKKSTAENAIALAAE